MIDYCVNFWKFRQMTPPTPGASKTCRSKRPCTSPRELSRDQLLAVTRISFNLWRHEGKPEEKKWQDYRWLVRLSRISTSICNYGLWYHLWRSVGSYTKVATLIVATIYLQLIQNRYMFRSFTVLQCSHQHCVQPVASDVEVLGYL